MESFPCLEERCEFKQRKVIAVKINVIAIFIAFPGKRKEIDLNDAGCELEGIR